MKQITKSVRIHAPASKIYEYMTDPTNLPTVWPSMVEVSNVKRSADGAHSFDWVYKMAGVRFSGHAQTRKATQNKYVELENKAGIKSIFRWTYDGQDGATEVKLEVEYDVPVPLLGKFAEAFLVRINEREADTLLANLKEHMETSEAVPIRSEAAKEKRV